MPVSIPSIPPLFNCVELRFTGCPLSTAFHDCFKDFEAFPNVPRVVVVVKLCRLGFDQWFHGLTLHMPKKKLIWFFFLTQLTAIRLNWWNVELPNLGSTSCPTSKQLNLFVHCQSVDQGVYRSVLCIPLVSTQEGVCFEDQKTTSQNPSSLGRISKIWMNISSRQISYIFFYGIRTPLWN